MPSTIKLQDATNNSMDALFKTMNTNTAKEVKTAVDTTPKVDNKEIKTVTKKEDPEIVIKDTSKVGVCFNVPKYIKDMWKTYFAAHGLTMTEGLIQAVNYMKEQEEKGEIKVSAISVVKN